MFDITRRDIAWGAGIASVVGALTFFSVINSVVNSTGRAFGDGKKDLVHAARGVIATGILSVKTDALAIVYMAEEEILVGPMTLAEAKAEAAKFRDADAVVFSEGSREYQIALEKLKPSYQIAARWPQK